MRGRRPRLTLCALHCSYGKYLRASAAAYAGEGTRCRRAKGGGADLEGRLALLSSRYRSLVKNVRSDRKWPAIHWRQFRGNAYGALRAALAGCADITVKRAIWRA